jgi:hypothetical protein
MTRERVFTGEDREWIKENYPHLTNTACVKALKCSYNSLKRLVKDCGLDYKCQSNTNTKFIAKKAMRFVWLDAGAKGERCMDCKRYVRGGICSRTGRDVGALWQKNCFE